jgi:hypothetical protein
MSMMSEKLMPSACEVHIAGTVAMYALQLASGRPQGRRPKAEGRRQKAEGGKENPLRFR